MAEDYAEFPELDDLEYSLKHKFEQMAGILNGYESRIEQLETKNEELTADNIKLAEHVMRLLGEKEHGQG